MNQAIHFALRKADLNDDGRLSFEEFEAFLYVLRTPKFASDTAALVFALFDTDRNGFVDEMEFRQIFRYYLGHAPTEEEFQAEWVRLDAANKGRVSKKEYAQWLQTSSNPVFQTRARKAKVLEPKCSVEDRVLRVRRKHKEKQGMMKPSASAPAAWRPWHGKEHMCWAKVQQNPPPVEENPRIAFGNIADITEEVEQRISRSAGGVEDRPRWTPYLKLPNHNWATSRGINRRHPTMRTFIARPQTVDELRRHYAENPGFDDHLKNMDLPEPNFFKQSKYSGDRLEVRTAPELIPERSKLNYGRMKNPKTGLRQHWQDNWSELPQLRDKYVNGSNSLRCMGPPPRWMEVDEYYNPSISFSVSDGHASLESSIDQISQMDDSQSPSVPTSWQESSSLSKPGVHPMPVPQSAQMVTTEESPDTPAEPRKFPEFPEATWGSM